MVDHDGGKLSSLLSKITGAYEEYVRSMLDVATAKEDAPESNNETVQEASKEEDSVKGPQESTPNTSLSPP